MGSEPVGPVGEPVGEPVGKGGRGKEGTGGRGGEGRGGRGGKAGAGKRGRESGGQGRERRGGKEGAGKKWGGGKGQREERPGVKKKRGETGEVGTRTKKARTKREGGKRKKWGGHKPLTRAKRDALWARHLVSCGPSKGGARGAAAEIALHWPGPPHSRCRFYVEARVGGEWVRGKANPALEGRADSPLWVAMSPAGNLRGRARITPPS